MKMSPCGYFKCNSLLFTREALRTHTLPEHNPVSRLAVKVESWPRRDSVFPRCQTTAAAEWPPPHLSCYDTRSGGEAADCQTGSKKERKSCITEGQIWCCKNNTLEHSVPFTNFSFQVGLHDIRKTSFLRPSCRIFPVYAHWKDPMLNIAYCTLSSSLSYAYCTCWYWDDNNFF